MMRPEPPCNELRRDPAVSQADCTPDPGRGGQRDHGQRLETVFVEREGLPREAVDVSLDERNLRVAEKNIARALGDDVWRSSAWRIVQLKSICRTYRTDRDT